MSMVIQSKQSEQLAGQAGRVTSHTGRGTHCIVGHPGKDTHAVALLGS